MPSPVSYSPPSPDIPATAPEEGARHNPRAQPSGAASSSATSHGTHPGNVRHPLLRAWRDASMHRSASAEDDYYAGLSPLPAELPLQRGEFNDDTPKEARLLRSRYLASRVVRNDHTLTSKELREAVAKMMVLAEGDRRKLVSHLLSWERTDQVAAIRDALEHKFFYLTQEEQAKLGPSSDINTRDADALQKHHVEGLCARVRTALEKSSDAPYPEHGLSGDEQDRLEKAARIIVKNLRLLDVASVIDLSDMSSRVRQVERILLEGLYLQRECVDERHHFRIDRSYFGKLASPSREEGASAFSPEQYEALEACDKLALGYYAVPGNVEINRVLSGLQPPDANSEMIDKYLSHMLDTFRGMGMTHRGIVRKGVTRFLRPGDFIIGKPYPMKIYCSTTYLDRLDPDYTDSKKPFAIEIASRNGIDISGPIAYLRNGPFEGEVLFRKDTLYLPVKMGFDPSYVQPECENGMYVTYLNEMELPEAAVP